MSHPFFNIPLSHICALLFVFLFHTKNSFSQNIDSIFLQPTNTITNRIEIISDDLENKNLTPAKDIPTLEEKEILLTDAITQHVEMMQRISTFDGNIQDWSETVFTEFQNLSDNLNILTEKFQTLSPNEETFLLNVWRETIEQLNIPQFLPDPQNTPMTKTIQLFQFLEQSLQHPVSSFFKIEPLGNEIIRKTTHTSLVSKKNSDLLNKEDIIHSRTSLTTRQTNEGVFILEKDVFEKEDELFQLNLTRPEIPKTLQHQIVKNYTQGLGEEISIHETRAHIWLSNILSEINKNLRIYDPQLEQHPTTHSGFILGQNQSTGQTNIQFYATNKSPSGEENLPIILQTIDPFKTNITDSTISKNVKTMQSILKNLKLQKENELIQQAQMKQEEKNIQENMNQVDEWISNNKNKKIQQYNNPLSAIFNGQKYKKGTRALVKIKHKGKEQFISATVTRISFDGNMLYYDAELERHLKYKKIIFENVVDKKDVYIFIRKDEGKDLVRKVIHINKF